nr:MAG TPA: hypothetical protein [Caudoviricetes sp.]
MYVSQHVLRIVFVQSDICRFYVFPKLTLDANMILGYHACATSRTFARQTDMCRNCGGQDSRPCLCPTMAICNHATGAGQPANVGRTLRTVYRNGTT